MNNVRVRFAPSPTGWMHIGNTRTAVFNWLLAKKLGGEFMLRIDDTDAMRSKKEYEDAIRDVLLWLGLSWDKEARQSERKQRYDEVRDVLMKQGRIYACWESAEELEVMRKKLMSQGKPPIYDRGALRLSEEDIARYRAEGRRPHYRFKLNDGVIEWDDMVRGHIRYEAANLADPVIIREDGSYLYHLPSVIDDFDFGITHIVRGEDHVTNTAAQIQMFEALGGQAPQFAHLPLLTGKEGKLSKRLGSLGVRELRAEGIENMAICAFLAKLGTSEAIEPWKDLSALAQSLDFSKLGRSQPKFDEEELKLFNHKVVRQMSFAQVKDRLDTTEEFWEAIKGNLDTVQEAKIWSEVCFAQIVPIIEDTQVCAAAAENLDGYCGDDATYNEWINAIKTATGKKGKELFHPLRLALTGTDNGPELKVLLKFIGRQKAKLRLSGQNA
ncbi:MAG: glutamate--tRNA ligase [Alphaproteobacteria bacterium]|nr:glutamate--tRNA ligase [Alphaproteobacteria bacterium]MBQ9235283.1 glutamate--tRNA ligase [Alphaproteobacteria bacterium]